MKGWLAEDQASISNSTAVQNEDGTYTIHFNHPNEINNINAIPILTFVEKLCT